MNLFLGGKNIIKKKCIIIFFSYYSLFFIILITYGPLRANDVCHTSLNFSLSLALPHVSCYLRFTNSNLKILMNLFVKEKK
jgi:hypothetical protein